MELFITDLERSERKVIDSFTAFTLETRYNELGYFELTVPKEKSKYFKDDAVIECSEDLDFQSIVSYMEADSSNENGTILVKGFSLNYILSRRIFKEEYSYKDKTLNFVINDVISKTINSSESGRDLNVSVVFSNTSLRDKVISYAGKFEDAHVILSNICINYDIGFNLKLNEDSSLTLNIYDGSNLSNSVILSRDRNTALNNFYVRSSDIEKNFLYILGENNLLLTLDIGNKAGFERKEGFLDFSGISQTVNGSLMPIQDYKDLLLSKARVEAKNLLFIESLDAEPNFNKIKYGKDFKMGDIVSSDEQDFDVRISKRIVGITQIWSEEGYYISLILGTQKGLLRY